MTSLLITIATCLSFPNWPQALDPLRALDPVSLPLEGSWLTDLRPMPAGGPPTYLVYEMLVDSVIAGKPVVGSSDIRPGPAFECWERLYHGLTGSDRSESWRRLSSGIRRWILGRRGDARRDLERLSQAFSPGMNSDELLAISYADLLLVWLSFDVSAGPTTMANRVATRYSTIFPERVLMAQWAVITWNLVNDRPELAGRLADDIVLRFRRLRAYNVYTKCELKTFIASSYSWSPNDHEY